jgi:hypothetical protein
VEIEHTVEQPADPAERGRWVQAGWNKLVYDPDGRRVLFYDRWADERHGGYTIYGNCLFAFDPAAGKLVPLRIDNWTKFDVPDGGYRTVALPDNGREPTPCPRHVYNAFDYVPELGSVFICNGANQSALGADGALLGHDLCDGAWRLDVKTGKWDRIESAEYPPNRLDDAMAWCPDTRSLVYSGADGQLWILEPEKPDGGGWRKAKQSPPPHTSMGRTIFYDPTSKRMLLVGGGTLDGWMKGPERSPEFREVYAFDPATETVRRLADAPTALYCAHLAYDRKRGLFFTVAVFNGGEQPSGMFAYDPSEDSWREVAPANPIPPHRGWNGWMMLCYDSHDDCLVGTIHEKWYALRYEPPGE